MRCNLNSNQNWKRTSVARFVCSAATSQLPERADVEIAKKK